MPQLGGFAFIGEGIPIGLGAAFQIKYRKEVLGEENADQVAVNFFGDGTCNVGEAPHSSCTPTGYWPGLWLHFVRTCIWLCLPHSLHRVTNDGNFPLICSQGTAAAADVS